jgi:hypothetical protein
MEILIEISEGADGRLAGTVRALDRQDAQPFSGTLEFLAAIEGLCRAQSEPLPTERKVP